MFDAIVLAGGKSSRMGGADKPAMVVGGRTMLDAALAAVRHCRVVVVGPPRALPGTIRQTREQPPGAGPVAAIAAGLLALPGSAEFTYVLAADIPFISAEALAQLPCAPAEAVFAADRVGNVQYLVGLWRTDFLRARLARLTELTNQPMKALVPTDPETTYLPAIDDVDTPHQIRRATVEAAVLEVTQARHTIAAGVSPLAAVDRMLGAALGGALAADLRSLTPLPRFDVSAMDGYAVAGSGPWQLREDIGYAGRARPDELVPGTAVRIATGARVPDGADAVIRDEHVWVTGQVVTRRPDIPNRNDIRAVGEDWPIGHLIATAHQTITPAVVSAAASGEVFSAPVRGPVTAHVVLTGDEIRSEGPLHDGQTRDTIGPVLRHYLAGLGVRTESQAHLRDSARHFDDVLASAAADLIVIVGATGRGAADHLREALARAGARVLVERVATRPGGSQLVARLPDDRIVFGLPGNPYAAIATVLLTGPAIVSALIGNTAAEPVLVALHNADQVAADRVRIVPVRAHGGHWTADQGVRTAHLAGLIGAHALAVVPPGAAAQQTVEILPLTSPFAVLTGC